MKTTKSLLLLAFLMMLGFSSALAQVNQKFAYVDTEYILQNIPEYGDAQEEINQMSVRWEKELRALRTKIDQMKRDYQTESVLLSDDMKRKKEEAIAAKEQEFATLQMQYYGLSNLFRRRFITPSTRWHRLETWLLCSIKPQVPQYCMVMTNSISATISSMKSET